MTDRIDALCDLMVADLVELSGWPRAEVEPLVRDLIARTYRVYLETGAPAGLSDAAFLRWLEGPSRVTPAA